MNWIQETACYRIDIPQIILRGTFGDGDQILLVIRTVVYAKRY